MTQPQQDPWDRPGGGRPPEGLPFSQDQPGPHESHGSSDPYGRNPPPYGGGQPYGGDKPPYGGGQPPYGGGQPPYGGGQPPYGGGQPPYGGGQPPYGGGQPPYGGGYEGGYGGGYGAVPPTIAGKGKRLVGIIIDWILYALVACCIALPFGGNRGDFVVTRPDGTTAYEFDRLYSGGQVFASLLAAVLAFLYFWLLTHRWNGQTLGKKAMGTRVVREQDGGPVDASTSAVRAGVFVVLAYICCVGFLVDAIWIFTNPKNQTLHDKAAKTVVVEATGPNPYQAGTPGQPY
ncbi:RDD family protein [Actinocorallia aurantiaca]|uniref:RDD domain-containing protein n=1 Tax=Actinocorallia aurantiaca TaxID=46204 RepID=A0ABP6GH96_9ACTN